ncbi:MAG: hypothetical protein KA175_11240 [Flavobacteriales bacterium]|nr:hypothetical protein [Flavobacteriales bacterium]MBP6698185.1 hypothetical protein [Flavobacteriales bacterium]
MIMPSVPVIRIAGAVCATLCAVTCFAQAPADGWPKRLAGIWEGTVGGDRYMEEWRQVDANTYEGRSTTWSGEKEVGQEQLRITSFAGHWLYLASPGGKSVTCFMRVSAEPDTWIFENKEHDFPKRIGYQLEGKDGLKAWIAGTADADQRMEFHLTRATDPPLKR